jgi:23S rRNA pseudouridine2604 synthase
LNETLKKNLVDIHMMHVQRFSSNFEMLKSNFRQMMKPAIEKHRANIISRALNEGTASYNDRIVEDSLQRVSKLLASKGTCSRREAEVLIASEQIRINGEIVVAQGCKASKGDTIEVTAVGQAWLDKKLTLVLNKPPGYESSTSQDNNKNVISLICKENERLSEHISNDLTLSIEFLNMLSIVGRLDKESRGLLILTGDGSLARKLISTSSVLKKYLVVVDKDIHTGHVEYLGGQLYLDDETLLPMSISYINPRIISITLQEGKNRQIRRCCAMVGLRVLELYRTSIGSVELGNLPEGSWRQLTLDEVLYLKNT